MYEVLRKQRIAPGLNIMSVRAPEMARKVRPGQFVILMVDEKGERIPLSVADWDREEGSITVVFQEVGTSTRKLGLLEAGDGVFSFAGPMGKPSPIRNYGTVVVISGCYGTGPAYPIARALKEAGCRVIHIVEGRNRDWLFWLDRLEAVADRLILTCGDGSMEACYANDPLSRILEEERVDRIYAIGCTFMMMEAARATLDRGVPTRVSLTPIMVDGTGMCGACRVNVGGRVMFGCVDGPEFDGHQVDWKSLIERAGCYLKEEVESLDRWDRENWHRAMNR
ncbi:MAG: sulfide/dihydroorotate dehydrogenase-like FAD/NAD-binding protein [Methanosarcinales archaeon]|nr:sulfide/dihydroorotate dehydrogenase-like FAD/NAD-binding protein [Methanosarcinales archaeon]